MFITHGPGRGPFIVQKVRMASDAVFLNYLLSGLFDEYDLRFPSEGKDGSMPHSVFGLEKVLVNHIVVWHVAIIAVGLLPVCTVAPGGILGCHDMAVHTGRRIIRQV
jgi:hypothetical protein